MEIIEVVYFTFVFHNLFWKLGLLLVLLIVIDFQIKFKIVISRNNLFPTYVTNWCQKWEGGI